MALRKLTGPAGPAASVQGHPGIGIGREPPDFGWKSIVHEIVERGLLEDLPKARTNGDPDFLKAFRRPGVFDGFGAVAADVGHRPVDGPDDIGKADIRRRSREPESATRAALALHDAGVLEREEHALQEFDGDVLPSRDHIALQPCIVLHDRELRDGAKGIVGTSRDAHVPIVPRTRLRVYRMLDTSPIFTI